MLQDEKNEVYRIYQAVDLVTIIKTLRLKWLGHVNRMEDHKEPKREEKM
jgi:hypothetical protein